MVNGRSRNTGRRWVVAALFGVSLALVPPVMAEDRTVPPEPGTEMAAAGAEGYEKIIVLLQEQNKNNSRELRQIKREIAALGQQLENPGIREIMGGIGYILGLFGVAAYIMSRKNNISGGR